MSIRTRTVPSPGRIARRVQAADRVKSGAAQRAYAKRRLRAEQLTDTPRLPRTTSAMSGRIPFVAAIIAMLGCGLALTLLLTTRAAEDSYQLSDARQLNRTLAEERAALQREVEAADSAPELAARARELGMIPADDPARLLIAPDGAVIVVGTPTPVQGAPAPPLNTTPRDPASPAAQGEQVVPVTAALTPARTPDPTAGDRQPAPAQPAPAPVPPGDPAAPAAPVEGQPAPLGTEGQPVPPVEGGPAPLGTDGQPVPAVEGRPIEGQLPAGTPLAPEGPPPVPEPAFAEPVPAAVEGLPAPPAPVGAPR
ncbi:hypothetical protein [Nocardia shimofusensis]|uniref:hypothetical protein n=1 Tax=Nocardia shimofusensis TaxID=228596 RepID=UPI000B06A277|nr:hypothetical protein [Nocardia shimofusensis]